MKGHLEIIRCPECDMDQIAFVEHSDPFNSYYHECETCGHVILESEWNTITKFKYRSDVVPYYANKIMCRREHEYYGKINQIILKKYTAGGLLKIKEDAWRYVDSLKKFKT